jgi:hypothetical protein
MHKDKRLVPVRLTVRKISGIGEDTQFMGVIEVSRLSVNLLKREEVIDVKIAASNNVTLADMLALNVHICACI